MNKTASDIETALRKVTTGARVFTGLFWETVTEIVFDKNIMRNPYPNAVICDKHLVELHNISDVVLVS